MLECFGQPCQKQPSTMTTTRCSRNAGSGDSVGEGNWPEWKCYAWRKLLGKAQDVRIGFAVGDVFQQSVVTHAVQREVGRAEFLVGRIVVGCEWNHVALIIKIIAHGLDSKFSEVRP